MAIKTNLKSLQPRREHFKREITLLSGGYYNPAAFPGGKVTVYPWDSHIDSWFQERLRLPQKEYALWEAAEKVADLNKCPVRDMVMGDVWTILMVSKAICNDCVVEYIARCPHCERAEQASIRIPDELQIQGKKTAEYPGFENITLPESKDVVTIRPLIVGDNIYILERTPEQRTKMSDMIAGILLTVKAVGGGTVDGVDEVLEWYNALSPKDAEFLQKEQGRLHPQLDTRVHHKCENCSEKFSYDLELNRDFFRAGER
jgi:hypothetical protein